MKWTGLFLVAALMAGCASPGYYVQAIGGQAEIWVASRPLDEAGKDPAVAEEVRQRLALATRMREFASRELALPDNGSYRKYADLGRPYVVWNVFAAEPLSVKARQWCFPVAGCVGYRGYFSEAAAQAFAMETQDEGYDVYVGGVPAYSTLGWLDDPILNTFLHYPDIELARLLFHELAHQVVYVSGDTTFNESFAVTVEEVGVLRWIERFGTPEQRQAYARMAERRGDFRALIKETRDRLARLYAGPGTATDKLAEKAAVLARLQTDYRTLRDGRWGGFGGYERWFAGDINNATLASVGFYHDRVPAFRALLAENGNDLERFYVAVRALSLLPSDERTAWLAALSGDGADAGR